ncbi:MAG: hypothetical protein ACR2G3_03860 [Solirubrobacterales bacterium]
MARRSAWGPDGGTWFIAGGSHAGRAFDPRAARHRWTRPDAVRLIPVEAIARGEWAETEFEVTPPWLKRVYRDPEYVGTD